MKILIFGASGMIGHHVWYKLNKEFPGQVYGTVRKKVSEYEKYGFFCPEKLISSIDVVDFEHVINTLNKINPDVVINCVGITLRKPEIKDLDYCLKVNSLFPQKLGRWASEKNKRLIHLSTDCVFSGKDSFYTENSIPDADDIYGRTKFLGEVLGSHSLTIRCPLIGREIEGKTELIEWFFKQKDLTIKGFSKAIYSGLTTAEFSRELIKIIKNYTSLTGLIQISSDPISKYELLKQLNEISQNNCKLLIDDSYATNKSLNSEKYRQLTGYVSPCWKSMLEELVLEKSLS